MDVPKWQDLVDRLASNSAQMIPYKRGTTGVKSFDTHVGAVFHAKTASGMCVGTYTVTEPPPKAVSYHVAEIHGHFKGEDNDGIMDWPM